MAPPDGQDRRDGWQDALVVVGTGAIGRIQSVVRDPLSQRVRQFVTSYADRTGADRRVAIPVEWVVEHRPGRVVLGVGSHELDGLFTYDDPALSLRPVARVGER